MRVIDSHTGGEPTRVIVAGGPELGPGTMAQQRDRLQAEFDHLRRAIIHEPRGSDVMVGALLTPPVSPEAIAGVIFFNNVGYLNMCGHGTLGVAAVLAYLGRLEVGQHLFDTPVGSVQVEWHGGGRATIENVPAYRYRTAVEVHVPELGTIRGDIAWGGNWFFLIADHGQSLTLDRTPQLTDYCSRIRTALQEQGITGEGGGEIDHIELFGPPADPQNHSRNFVLCPGLAYDRSPCGTGTSAKLACLAADGKLAPGQVWRQESILGSVFAAEYRMVGEALVPRITGTAFVNGELQVIFDPADPFAYGIPGY